MKAPFANVFSNAKRMLEVNRCLVRNCSSKLNLNLMYKDELKC